MTDRCEAAHRDDRRPCVGPADAVNVIDRLGAVTPGCVRHASVLLAGLDRGRVTRGSVDGAAIAVYQKAQTLRPFDFHSD